MVNADELLSAAVSAAIKLHRRLRNEGDNVSIRWPVREAGGARATHARAGGQSRGLAQEQFALRGALRGLLLATGLAATAPMLVPSEAAAQFVCVGNATGALVP